MEFLSLSEKRFIACFVENCHAVLKPRHQNYISLYSYLDGTFESESQQREQIKTNDVDLVDWLNLISYSVDNEHVYAHVMKSLKKCGYLGSAVFRDRFEQVAGWLCMAESDEYRLKVRNELKAKCKDSTPKSAEPRNGSLPKMSKIASPIVSRNEAEALLPKSILNPDERNAILQVRRSNKQFFFPHEVFCSDFDKEVRFYAAFYAFQLQVNRYATIDGAAYYRALVFNEKERCAIQRWVELYHSIPESEVNPASTQFQRVQLSPAEEKLSLEQFYKRVKQAEDSLSKKAKERANVSTSDPPDDWGRTRRPRLLDDGNSWREQK